MARFSKTQIAGFVITGAAVGAALALMWAPKSGEQMRKDIRRLTKKTVDQLDDLQSDIREHIAEGYGKVRTMITTA